MKFALVFPGQGSQKLGMMDAYGDHPAIRETFAEASAALGRDLWQLVSAGPAEALRRQSRIVLLMLNVKLLRGLGRKLLRKQKPTALKRNASLMQSG